MKSASNNHKHPPVSDTPARKVAFTVLIFNPCQTSGALIQALNRHRLSRKAN